eukprot:274151-Amphidinium_carterae.1
MWNEAVMGVTESTERMRRTDVWWNQVTVLVTDQLRAGHLTKEQYLHGPSRPWKPKTLKLFRSLFQANA